MSSTLILVVPICIGVDTRSSQNEVKANASSDPKTRLSDAELMAEMFSLTLAGHETTASTLTFLMYELARNPDYQKRMREEIRLARSQIEARGDSDFTMDDLDGLTLTINAIKVSELVSFILPGLVVL